MIKWIEHKQKKILYSDYRGLNQQAGIDNLMKEVEIIRQQKQPILVLDNFNDYFLTSEFLALGKKYGKEVQPNVKKMAQIGITGAKRIIANAFMLFSGMNLRFFETEAVALVYLIKD